MVDEHERAARALRAAAGGIPQDLGGTFGPIALLQNQLAPDTWNAMQRMLSLHERLAPGIWQEAERASRLYDRFAPLYQAAERISSLPDRLPGISEAIERATSLQNRFAPGLWETVQRMVAVQQRLPHLPERLLDNLERIDSLQKMLSRAASSFEAVEDLLASVSPAMARLHDILDATSNDLLAEGEEEVYEPLPLIPDRLPEELKDLPGLLERLVYAVENAPSREQLRRDGVLVQLVVGLVLLIVSRQMSGDLLCIDDVVVAACDDRTPGALRSAAGVRLSVAERSMAVRTRPRRNSPRLGTIVPGQVVAVVRLKRRWIRVTFLDVDQEVCSGWVLRRYLAQLPRR